MCYTADFEADMLLGIVKVSSLKLDQTKPGQTSKKSSLYMYKSVYFEACCYRKSMQFEHMLVSH